MAAAVGSFAPGRPPTWLKPPVDWGVTLLGVLAEGELELMPL
jgi:hypothetical protein